jgi:hypothetical protein
VDYAWRKKFSKTTVRRALTLALSASLLGSAVFGGDVPRAASGPLYSRHTRDHFRYNMASSVRANHPAMAPLAAAIRSVSSNPLEQIVMVNDITHLLVDYDEDSRVYGVDEYHATLDEMLARRPQSGWLYLRDDCDGRAVFAAHILAALGIPWRFEASYWKEHAWVVARVNGVDYDLLDLRKNASETDRLSYKLFGHMFVRPSTPPPAFAWRRAWAQRTGRDLKTGITMGLLAVDSTRTNPHERFATDWTSRSPSGELSPVDDRALSVTVAGFPYGEPLHVASVANLPPAPRQAATSALSGSTGSRNSSGR